MATSSAQSEIFADAASSSKPQTIAFAVVLAGLAALFSPRLYDLVHNGTSIALFVLAVSSILLWMGLRATPMCPRVRAGTGGLVLLVGSLSAVLLEDIYKIPIVSTTPLLIALCLTGVVWSLYGGRAVRRQRFALVYLLLMTPTPVIVNVAVDVPLQMLSAMLASGFVRMFGVEAQRYGTTVRLHNGDLALRIIADCNGMRSGVAMFALAILLGWLLRASAGKWIVLVVAGVGLAYAANIVRLASLLLLLNHLGAGFQPMLPRAEEWIGAMLFVMALGGLALVARRLGCTHFRAL